MGGSGGPRQALLTTTAMVTPLPVLCRSFVLSHASVPPLAVLHAWCAVLRFDRSQEQLAAYLALLVAQGKVATEGGKYRRASAAAPRQQAPGAENA